MNYKELVFIFISSEDYHRDLIINALAGIGYDTFEETEPGFKTYILSDNFNQCYVRATFHKPHPEYSYEIVIDPKCLLEPGTIRQLL